MPAHNKILSFAVVIIGLALSATIVHARTAEQNTYVRYVKTGSDHLKAGDYLKARDSFEQALTYYDAGFDGHLGLGIAYFHLHEDAYAERELTRAADIDSSSATPYRFLGELAYRKDDLQAAVSYWEKAAALDPSDADTRARLDRIRKEHQAEQDFNRDITSHFSIKYEGREKIEAGRIVLRILEDAYGAVGKALSYYPDHEVQVILYSGKQFQEVTDAPGWSNGIYDGKIRIPIGGMENETPGLRKLLYHEYTHAVVRAITRQCPAWLNEGLAQYFEGREIDTHQKEMLKRLAAAKKLPSLKELEGSFMGLSGSQALSAYLFSLSSARYLIDTYGMYRVRSMLDELASGADTSKAISAGTMLSYDEFERGWKGSLE